MILQRPEHFPVNPLDRHGEISTDVCTTFRGMFSIKLVSPFGESIEWTVMMILLEDTRIMEPGCSMLNKVHLK